MDDDGPGELLPVSQAARVRRKTAALGVGCGATQGHVTHTCADARAARDLLHTSSMITDDRIKTLNPEMAATWIKGMGPMSEAQYRVLVIACRNGGYVGAGAGEHAGHVERVPASALLALVRRGHLTHCHGSEGGVAGRLSERSREKLADALKGQEAVTPHLETTAPAGTTKARNGVWTPWAEVLCVECDYAALKDGPRAQHYDKHLKAVGAMNRTEEVEQPDGDQLGQCNTCRCACWVRADVALLQQVGFKSAELDWEGPFGWTLEQTGGMCAALVLTTEDREVVVTAMDGEFFIGEYKIVGDVDERWTDAIRTWQSDALYQNDALKPATELAVLVEACARKAIDFIRNPEKVQS